MIPLPLFSRTLVGITTADDGIVRCIRYGRTLTVGHAPLPQEAAAAPYEQPALWARTVRAAYAAAQPRPFPRHAPVAITLPESAVFLRVITLPAMPAAQVPDAVRWEMEAHVPLALEEMWYDYVRVPLLDDPRERTIAVTATAVARETVAAVQVAARAAHLRLARLVPDTVAEAALLFHAAPTPTPLLVLSLGTVVTRVSIVIAHTPIFAVSVPVGMATLQQAIAQARRIDAAAAAALLRTEGIGGFLAQDALFRAVAPHLTLLRDEVAKAVRYHDGAFQARIGAVRGIVVTGPGSVVPGIAAYLVHATGLAVRTARPWRDDPATPLPPLPHDAMAAYGTAAGAVICPLTYDEVCH